MIRGVSLITMLVFVCFTSAGAKPDDANAAELKALVGKWKVASAELGGKDITEHLKEMKFEIKAGGKYTAQVGELKDDATFSVDLAKKPREMDVKPNGGPQKGKIVKAIYKLEGDTLIICYDHDHAENRQSRFESKEGTTVLLITYKREKN
ncbi:MAG TPA: TIGR03067 domain-containing protein [Gemmata sp.]|nr:TIGR03067 domain-containing protein [Gemmata sp.]